MYVFTCVAEGGSRYRNCFLDPSVRTSIPARQYLLSVICNSNSFQSILFKLCSVGIHIEDVHLLLWADLKIFSYILCVLNLVIFYHYMSWTVPSWCNLKLQQCSINIIQTLHSVGIHIEDVHLLLWADLKIFSYILCVLNLVIFYHYMSWTVPSWCNLKLQQCSINIIQTLHSVCIHIEDMHLLLWADLSIFFFNFLYVELSHFFITIWHWRYLVGVI
jgi:hypothetical protein